MDVSRRQPDRPAHAGSRLRSRAPVILVVAVGLAVTALLALGASRGSARTQHSLLGLQTRLVSAAGQAADQLYVEDHLGGAASLAAATNGNAATFSKAMAGQVGGKGPFISASLWRLTGTPPVLLAGIGRSPLLAAASPRFSALMRQALASPTFAVTRVASGHAVVLGLAAAASGPDGRFAVYAEEPLPASRRITEPRNSPIGPLNFALYLGHKPTPAALLESNAPVPLAGTTYTSGFAFGDTYITITTSARASLSGSLSADLPWIILGAGLVLTLLAALLTWRLVRGRERAEGLSREVRELYLEQRSVAVTLQRSLLPARLPEIPGVQIEARYLPGASGTEVGGDWYDVVPVGNGRFTFKVGDVSGRGIKAATVMASLHYAGRAYALEGQPPHVIIERLGRLLDLGEDGHFATVLCGQADVAAHTVLLASAGHLSPVLRSNDKTVNVRVEPGPPVGVPGTLPGPALVTVPPGGVLFAYTDGLVERRGETIDAGIERLQQAASKDFTSLGLLLDAIITELTDDKPTDDIALIAMRWLD